MTTTPTYAPYEPDSVTAPMCCEDPMVENTSARRYECASAFFALVNEGVSEGGMDCLAPGDVDDYLATTLTHWRESWLSDELVWCATARAGIDYHRLNDRDGEGTVYTGCDRLVEWTAAPARRRGWTGLRNGLPGLKPCKRCWPDGDPNALAPQ